jgi:hypothetical protein
LNTYLPLKVKNLTDETIYVKLRMDEMENAFNMVTNDVQFCFGTSCYITVDEGDVVPAAIAQAEILADGENPDGDKFQNSYEGDNVGQPVEYHMSLWLYGADNNPIEELVAFSYIYTPTAGTEDFTNLQNIGINVKNTVVKNTFDVDATVTTKLELFDVTGKQVSSIAVADGANSIDLSRLNAAVYIARFTTEDNKTAQIRIVKN